MMASRVFRRTPVLSLLLALIVLTLNTPPKANADSAIYPCDNERLGFGVTQNINMYDVAPLKAGWYVNWNSAPTAAHPAGLDFAQIIRVWQNGYVPSGDALATTIERNPASLWLIGNEPDSIYQDPVTPAEYVRVYHSAYHFIKQHDPLARVAIGGVIQATPLRMKWIDAVWTEYLRVYGQSIPVDVWNLHTFVLREVREGYGPQCAPPGAGETGSWGAYIPPGLTDNCGWWIEINQHDRLDLVRDQIVRFRTWMRDHGQQNKELIVSEYGILFPEDLGYPYTRVRDFMLGSFNYFTTVRDTNLGFAADGYRLVQRWAWYSLDDNNFESAGNTRSALMKTNGQLSTLGQDFARYASDKAAQCSPYVDLQAERFRVTTPNPLPYGENGIVRLEIQVRNQGTTTAPASQVRFWQGTPDARGALIGTAPLGTVPTRYQGTTTATLDWNVPAHGVHTVFAEVDATGQIAEAREDNNLAPLTFNFGSLNLRAGTPDWQVTRGPVHPQETTVLRLIPPAVTITQPDAPSPGITVVPPAYRATWYDGDPLAGGQVVETVTIPAPAQFGVASPGLAAEWTTLITGPRAVWTILDLASGAPETTTDDNRAMVMVPATADFSLVQATAQALALQDSETADAELRFRVVNLGALPPAIPLEIGLWPAAADTGPAPFRAGLADADDWSAALIWTALPLGPHAYIARVDPDNVLPETNEPNNQLTGTVYASRSRLALPLARKLSFR